MQPVASKYICHYSSPLGDISLSSDGFALDGLWFPPWRAPLPPGAAETEDAGLPVFRETFRWLDTYFSGREPDFAPPLLLEGSEFCLGVWNLLRDIPYGQTRTYGQIAAALGIVRGGARAVGGAAGRNPLALVVPCHRLVGEGGRLTGYAWGLDRKRELLLLESRL